MPPSPPRSSLPADRAASAEDEKAATATNSPGLDQSDDEVASQEDEANPGGDAPAAPLQKRRRVTRACDECRRKKIKCDGKQPCTHCQVYSYECTYDKPSNRRRNPAPQYIEALENKLSRAETLLRKFMPDVDLSDPSLDPAVQREFRVREQARIQKGTSNQPAATSSSSSSLKEGQLRSMIDSVGQLELNDRGDYDFHGNSSSSVFFRRMKDHFRALLGRENNLPSLPKQGRPGGVASLDSPKSSASSPWHAGSGPNTTELPSKATANSLCSQSLNNATCLLRIVHIPSFYEMLDGLYRKQPDSFDADDNRNLALAYSVMALGCMYNVPEKAALGNLFYEVAVEEGMKYYSAARGLIPDITECRDLTSLQALLFMILFIQSISNLSACYGYVGIALRSALRMGLHRNLPHSQINVIEAETRRRVFYVCRQMDTYVSALLGFPLLLSQEDIDQPLPTTVDDQYISKDRITTPPPGTPSFFEAFNAHVALMEILSSIVKHIYPLRGSDNTNSRAESPNSSFMISFSKIKRMEEELKQWNEQLPLFWRPSSEGPAEVVRVRNLLRFTFAHVQMVLYRPFLHYVSPRAPTTKSIDGRAYACGAAGITVARNIVHIGTEMRKQVSLVGPYWFTLFTEFFAIISLVFFVLENSEKDGAAEIWADAIAGKEMITALSKQSMAANRISEALTVLFDQLPDNLKNMKMQSGSSRKRPASDPRAESLMTATSLYPTDPSRGSATRSTSGSAEPPMMGSVSQAMPYVSGSLPQPSFTDPFSSGFDFSSLGLSAPSSNPTSVTGMHDPGHMNMQHPSTSAANSIHRLDAAMFPSDNPLEYPHHSTVDMAHHAPTGGPSPTPGSMHHDPQAFYVPQIYDDIEGQLMGPLPPYMMQSQPRPGFDFPMPMYTGPMLTMEQPHPIPHRPQQYPVPPTVHAQTQPEPPSSSSQESASLQRRRQQRRQRRPPRDVDDLLANTPWHGLFPQHSVD